MGPQPDVIPSIPLYVEPVELTPEKDKTEKFAASGWASSPRFSKPCIFVDKNEYLSAPVPDTIPRKPFYPSKFPNFMSRPCLLAPAPKPGKQSRIPKPDTFPKQRVLKDGLAVT